jgi:hypothetical protein
MKEEKSMGKPSVKHAGSRGSTRSLPTRLKEAQDRTLLLQKRMEVLEGRAEIRRLRGKLFNK